MRKDKRLRLGVCYAVLLMGACYAPVTPEGRVYFWSAVVLLGSYFWPGRPNRSRSTMRMAAFNEVQGLLAKHGFGMTTEQDPAQRNHTIHCVRFTAQRRAVPRRVVREMACSKALNPLTP
jgi:hypothetical protein